MDKEHNGELGDLSGWVMIQLIPGVALSMARNPMVLVGAMGKVPWELGVGNGVAG